VLFYPGLSSSVTKLKIRIMPMFCLCRSAQQNQFSQETGCNCDLSRSPLKKVVTVEIWKKHFKSVCWKIRYRLILSMRFYSNMNSKSRFYNRTGRIFCSWRYCRCVFFSNDNPYRIEFWDEVESIRSFDVATQLSIEIQKRKSR
jgi:hypothetical protein